MPPPLPPLCYWVDCLGGHAVWSGVDVTPSLSLSLSLSGCRKDDKDYALKQIEGTGISMSACREIAVSVLKFLFCLF